MTPAELDIQDSSRPGSKDLVVVGRLPAIIEAAGPRAREKFLEFFTAHIRNPNTRRAYLRACARFLDWCEKRGFGLEHVRPMVVAAFVEQLGREMAPPSVKQHLAAVRMLFDYLVVGQVVEHNPAAAVKGPKHVVRKGRTPVLTAQEARQLLDSIDTGGVVGLRDRAMIGVMLFSFARVGAVVGMKVEDYYLQGHRPWLRLHEKGGKRLQIPCHHLAQDYLEAYLAAAGGGEDKKGPLFRGAYKKTGRLTEEGISENAALKMVKRRAKAAGFEPSSVCCHTFRATGITTYLLNDGLLETAQAIAGHESARTTGLYDRRDDEVTLTEIERIRI
jgi:site-specific recombinase XerD